MTTPNTGHTPRSIAHRVDLLPLAAYFPDLAPIRCQRCGLRDATHYTHDDDLGLLVYCGPCFDDAYVDDLDFDYEPVSPEIEAATLAFIREHGPVTFVHLEQFLMEHGVEVRGNWAIADPENVVRTLWTNMSGEMMDLVATLEANGDIAYQLTSRRTYIEEARRYPVPMAGVPPLGEWTHVVLAAPRSEPVVFHA